MTEILFWMYLSGFVAAYIVSIAIDDGEEIHWFNALLWPLWVYWTLTDEAGK